MRKWVWSIIMAVIGFVVGIWWLREREATTPALKSYEDVPPAPAEKEDEGPRDSKADAPVAQADSIPPAPATGVDETVPPTAPDDLTQVNGIGPAFESALNDIGITTYAQLAAQSADDLAKRLDARGISAERIERDGWVEQARRLADSAKDE